MEILAALEIKKMLVDRLVNLLSRYRIFQRIRSISCLCPVPGLDLILMIIPDADPDPVLKRSKLCLYTGATMYVM